MTERDTIDRLLEHGKLAEAFQTLADAWNREPSLNSAQFVIAKYERHRADLDLIACRLAILRSVTVEPLVPLLRAAAYVNGIDLEVRVSDFDTYATEMLDPRSALYEFQPRVVLLALNTASVAPQLWAPSDDSESHLRTVADDTVARLTPLLHAFRKNSQADLIFHLLDSPDLTTRGSLESHATFGQRAAIESVNERLAAVARGMNGIHPLDYDALVARHGRRDWFDEGKWEQFRLPATAPNLRHIVDEWLRFIQPVIGAVVKVAVVDLDDTLWKGIVGEDGFARLKMGSDPPGTPYRALQRALLALRERGVVLAVSSKNDEADAMEVLEKHPDMLVRPAHFATLRINWESKAENIRSIASELNIGLDAVAFIDDNPVERAEVRAMLPQVRVLDLPPEPSKYARIVLENPFFQRVTAASVEDRQRTQFYKEQAQRATMLASAGSKEEFYRSLGQVADIAAANDLTLGRVAQLTQKTNQFNLTTRRYGEADIARFMSDPKRKLLTIKVSDRLGDNGIVGTAITEDDGDVCRLDTFLLSCRVIGRGIETAFIAYIADQARLRGKSRLVGMFCPTAKNELAKHFYEDHGFRRIADDADGSVWELVLANSDLKAPEWITVTPAPAVPA
ncbi:MAG TPA: HAD-IIIC family phosphatase [Candidatus Eremiobacteraceae bacterium]|nr:HAD-IIIC family phosphatase [Candidatus Eremiobacteraceae bacterium]